MSADLARLLDAVKREPVRPLPVRDLRDVQRAKVARLEAVVAAGRAAIEGAMA